MLQNIPLRFGLLVPEETGAIILANWDVSYLLVGLYLETEWEVGELDQTAELGKHLRKPGNLDLMHWVTESKSELMKRLRTIFIFQHFRSGLDYFNP